MDTVDPITTIMTIIEALIFVAQEQPDGH